MPRAARGAKVGGVAGRKPQAPKAPKGHKLADPLPDGEILTDFRKKQWRVGKAIGTGGFGQIYLASDNVSKPVDSSAAYVVKCEPHANGPLFCELHFYQKVAKQDLVKEWLSQHKLKNIGIPVFVAAGTHKDSTYRFMIMPRFGTDLQKMFESNGKSFSRKTVLMLALRLLDTLEYIHDKDYVHADIKASNLLMGYTKGTTDQVYLVDYGLAYKYIADGQHRPYKEDPRKAHDGTIEFTSIDAHKGVTPARRGDLEILGYCLLQWLCGRLPWEDKLNNKDYVRDQKIKYMKDIKGLMRMCFPQGNVPKEIQDFLQYVSQLGYSDRPDYDSLRQLFRTAMKKHGYRDDGRYEFDLTTSMSPRPPLKSPVKGRKRKSDIDDETSPPAKMQKARSAAPKQRVQSPVARPSPAKTKGGPSPLRGSRALETRSPKTTPRAKATGAHVHTRKPRVSPAARPRAAGGAKSAKVRRVRDSASVGTQTSPGLKGLKRSKRS